MKRQVTATLQVWVDEGKAKVTEDLLSRAVERLASELRVHGCGSIIQHVRIVPLSAIVVRRKKGRAQV